jgi:hypothetical protein
VAIQYSGRDAGRQIRYPRDRRLSPRELSARIERLYVSFVCAFLCFAGGAIGFTLGVVPYFRITLDVSQYNGFFVACVGVGAMAGIAVGIVFGPKWYRATEASPLVQRRMLAYMRRKNLDGRYAGQRTMSAASLRQLIGNSAKNAS